MPFLSETAEAATRAASAAASSAATKIMYGGSATSVGSWLACRVEMTGDDWTVLFGGLGALAALGGFLVSWYYKRADHRLKVAMARMQGAEV